jgi:hypothetical protein
MVWFVPTQSASKFANGAAIREAGDAGEGQNVQGHWLRAALLEQIFHHPCITIEYTQQKIPVELCLAWPPGLRK